MSQTEEQIIVSGSLLSITMFEQKLMRNFYVINSRLKRLQGLNDVETKMRNIEKEMKFVTTKVQSMVEKIPKDGNAVSKKQVLNICKDQFFDILNSSEDKVKQTQTFKFLKDQIQNLRSELKSNGRSNNQNHLANSKQIPLKPTSFTAGTILLSQVKKPSHPSQQLLNEVLSKQQNKIVNQIIAGDTEQFQKVKKDIENLYEIIDNLKVSIGKKHFVDREINQYDKYEVEDTGKSRQGGRKKKSPNKNALVIDNNDQLTKLNPNVSQRNSLSKKGEQSLQLERNTSKNNLSNGKSQMILKQDLIARKSLNQQLIQQIKTPTTLLNKDDFSGMFTNDKSNPNYATTQPHFNKLGQLTKIQFIPQNKLLSKAQRSKSLKKLDRVQKKLRLDDIKDINTVLKQIELRLQNKANLQVFNQFVKQFQQKIQILRITKDKQGELNDLRKMVYNLDTKLQYIASYLQSIANQDEALIVKKNWTCISCDKMIEKFNGKVGQHLSWDSIPAKKLSPSKIGAFGQAGQLASKIKNLMENSAGQ